MPLRGSGHYCVAAGVLHGSGRHAHGYEPPFRKISALLYLIPAVYPATAFQAVAFEKSARFPVPIGAQSYRILI